MISYVSGLIYLTLRILGLIVITTFKNKLRGTERVSSFLRQLYYPQSITYSLESDFQFRNTSSTFHIIVWTEICSVQMIRHLQDNVAVIRAMFEFACKKNNAKSAVNGCNLTQTTLEIHRRCFLYFYNLNLQIQEQLDCT